MRSSPSPLQGRSRGRPHPQIGTQLVEPSPPASPPASGAKRSPRTPRRRTHTIVSEPSPVEKREMSRHDMDQLATFVSAAPNPSAQAACHSRVASKYPAASSMWLALCSSALHAHSSGPLGRATARSCPLTQPSVADADAAGPVSPSSVGSPREGRHPEHGKGATHHTTLPSPTASLIHLHRSPAAGSSEC